MNIPNNTQLSILSQENIKAIAQSAPQARNENMESRIRCVNAGQHLLDRINDEGMTDALDEEVAAYIIKAKKTVQKMNEKRSPVTKLFDMIRSEFTAMENDIDPNKAGTVPYQLQQLRNEYARLKHEEEQRKMKERMRMQMTEQQRNDYRRECEVAFTAAVSAAIKGSLGRLNEIYDSMSVSNYDAVRDTIEGVSLELPADWARVSRPACPSCLTNEDADQIRNDAYLKLIARFKEDFKKSVSAQREYLLDILSSRRQELEAIEKASVETAEAMRKEVAEREAAEKARREKELKAEEEKRNAEISLAQKQTEMSDLFGVAAAQAGDTIVKARVSKRISLINPEGILPILSLWWQHEGNKMTCADLQKMFKKQIACCEKLAKDDVFIQSDYLEYFDDVKAK